MAAVENTSAAENAPAPLLYTLYIGDIDSTVVESQIEELYSRFPGFTTASLCRNESPLTGNTRHYAYVNFLTLPQAKEAMEATNHKVINGKAIRVMESKSNWDSHNNGVGNIFVKNLNDSIDNSKLEEIFSKYGKIISCKVMVTEEGNSKGYGFVQFESPESAQRAIESANDTTVDGKKLYVSVFKKKEDRFREANSEEYYNLYFKNFDVTEEELREKFAKFGEITSFFAPKDDNGNSKGFGFVNFAESKAACQARESMDGTVIGSKALYVARAQTKNERQQFLRQRSEQLKTERFQQHKDCNLYVKNIDDKVADGQLKDHFAKMGRVVTSRIMRTEKGVSLGYGFVCFSAPEEAAKSIAILNGSLFHGKPLYVAIAQSKEERKKILETFYTSKVQSTTLTPPSPPISPFPFPAYFHSRPPLPLPLPLPPQFPFVQGFQYFAPPPMMPNYAMMRFPEQRPYFNNCGTGPVPFQRPHFAVENRQHQRRHPAAVKTSKPNQHKETDWRSDLAAASPRHRKDMIWDSLFPLVHKLKGDAAGEITQMLIAKMDNTEILVLLESPAALAREIGAVEEALKRRSKITGFN
ncbi:Polyadenylate-binding protein 7 [Linum grandiflorum]